MKPLDLFRTVPLVAATLLGATSASADDAACLDAATKGQRFRDTHKLLEARAQLRVCAASACPPVVQSDCAGWLASVDKALPSVVVTAKDDAGGILVDVKVTVDGQPFATRLEGEAVPINPGSHAFHFEGPNGATLDQGVVAAEGEQNQRVAVVLASKAPARPAGVEGAEGPAARGAAGGGGTWKTVGWAVGGAGVVALGVGTVFGVMAINDHNSAKCNAQNVCLTGPLDDANSAATAADIGLIAGGVLLAGGVGLLLFAPSGAAGDHAATTVRVAPVLAQRGGGFGVGGTWW